MQDLSACTVSPNGRCPRSVGYRVMLSLEVSVQRTNHSAIKCSLDQSGITVILGRLRSHSSTGAAEEGGYHSLPVRATDRTRPLSTLATLLAVSVFCHLDQYHLIPLLRCLLSGGGSAPSQAAPVTNRPFARY